MRFHKNVLPIVREALRSPEIQAVISSRYGNLEFDETNDIGKRELVRYHGIDLESKTEVEFLNEGWNNDNKSWDDPLILSQAVERGLIDLVDQGDCALHMIETALENGIPEKINIERQVFYTNKRRIKKFLKKWRNRKLTPSLDFAREVFHKMGL